MNQAQIAKLYLNDQVKPLYLTQGQMEIFNLIAYRKHPRLHLMAHTRYGKSLTVALAVLLRVATFPEKWAIVAPSGVKAKIIMGYLIQHIFDNEYFKQKFVIEPGESEDRIRRERSKNRLNFKHPDGTYGEVFTVSADARNKQMAGDSLMGFGAPNVVLDESSLVDDDIESKIFRMLGDSMDNFYCEIGNPFRRNHFRKAYLNPAYHKVNITWEQGLAEGRVNQDFIEEVKKKPNFNVLYENKFPAADAMDLKGWFPLITDTEYDSYLRRIDKDSWFGAKRLGVDVARGGGNCNVWVMRTENYAKVLNKNQDNNLMSVVGTTILMAKEHEIDSHNVWVDDTGVGGGVTDRLVEQDHYVHGVKLAEKADEETLYINRRAENYWRLRKWLKEGGGLANEDDWSELLTIKYKAQDSSGKLQIMPKKDMVKEGYESPDTADALMLTFDGHPYLKEQEEVRRREEQQPFDRYELI